MKKFLIILTLLLTSNLWASSMRRCALLPVTDSVGGAIGYKVFESIENKLKHTDWCQYVSNSSMIHVFSRYRENLPKHLKERNVLKTVSEKLNVGSLIRINLLNNIHGVELQLDIIGDNGDDVLFSEVKENSSDDVIKIVDQVEEWLEVYRRTIPYDAKVTGVLGDQVTIDIGRNFSVEVDQEVEIKRVQKVKKHPLLKKVVGWDTMTIGSGTITNVSENQALSVVKDYSSNKRVDVGDWINIGPKRSLSRGDISFRDRKEMEPGRLGYVSGSFVLQSASVDSKTPTSSPRMSGPMVGVDILAEAWITRNYFAGLQVARTIGTLKKSSGKPDKDHVNAQYGSFKLFGGYKYLPLGFFYGPQVNLYAGYANYVFDLDYVKQDGFGKMNLSGILLGASTNLPINKEYRFVGRIDLLAFPGVNDNDDLYDSKKNASLLDLEAGIQYIYTPRMTLDASLGTLAGKAKFKGDYREISYQENIKLKVGATFNF